MVTKTITGNYPSGYALSPTYQTLNIASTASVGGTGVSTSSSQPSTINNLGRVNAGFNNGVSLADGGAITNGSSTNTSALIEGVNAIVVGGAAATINNFATIESYGAGGFSGYPDFATSISLTKGGTVTNQTSGDITNGISISGGAGSVKNFGTIGAPETSSYIFGPMGIPEYYYTSGPSISMNVGGSVTNGSSTATSATISNEVGISGGTGIVVNYGHIGGVGLSGGGSVVNGTANDTTASISGVGISGASGQVTNYGTINGVDLSSGTVTNVGTISAFQVGVDISGGGTVTNGSATATGALISAHGNGITIAGGAGTLSNFGAISSTASPGGGASYSGVDLIAGGTFTNGSAQSHAATVSGIVGVTLQGSGTITNFGRITGTGGTAISLNSSQATLIEESSGVVDGSIVGGGGTLQFAAGSGPSALSSNISGFSSIQIQSGASAVLYGKTSTVSGSTLTNSGSVLNNGEIVLLGQTVSSGTIANETDGTIDFAADVSITTDPKTKTGTFVNYGLIEKTGGAGTSIIRTGNGSLQNTGTIDVETGILELTGAGVSQSGPIEGAGTIEFGVGSTSLTGSTVTTAGLMLAGTGAHLTLASSLNFAGVFSESAGTELSIGAGDVLTLSGSSNFKGALIDSRGQLVTSGATILAGATVAGSAEWLNTGTVTETGQLTLNSNRASDFYNEKGGVFDIAGNVGIDGASGVQFANAGLLKKTVGSSGAISVGMANTGVIEVGSGALDLKGAVTGTGKLQIDSGKILQADSSVAVGQTVSFQGTGDQLKLTDAPQFAGSLSGFGGTDKLDLTQFGAVTSLVFTENAKNTGGTLVVKDGSLEADISFLGQYMTSGFHAASDGHSGTTLSYTPPAQASMLLAHPATS